MKDLVRKIDHLQATVMGWLSFVAPTLVRLVLGYSMWVDGNGKLQHLDKVTSFFSSLYLPFSNIPLPHAELQASAVANLEYYGGFLLMIGLFTRPVSLCLAGAMVGAILLSDSKEFVGKWGDGTPTDSSSFANFILAIVTLFTGAGALSVDGIIGYFYRTWLEDHAEGTLRSRLGGIVTCWVLRGLVLLVLVALVPVSGVPAETMVSLGLKTKVVRAPHPGEFDENPPKEVVEYPPDIVHLGAFGFLLVALGGGAYAAFRPKSATS